MATVLRFKTATPGAAELALQLPANVNKELFESGFEHGMRSNTLTNFKASYRAGFRAAKQHLREIREAQGLHHFPGRTKCVLMAK